jgi:hypothetical protein
MECVQYIDLICFFEIQTSTCSVPKRGVMDFVRLREACPDMRFEREHVRPPAPSALRVSVVPQLSANHLSGRRGLSTEAQSITRA